MSKTYTKRTNAKRAAIAAGIPADQVQIVPVHGDGKVRFGFKQKAQQATAKAIPAAKGKVATKAPAPAREERNGVKRPRTGGLCEQVWAHLDKHGDMELAQIKAWAEKKGLNVNNAAIEIYGWRRFNGIKRESRAAN